MPYKEKTDQELKIYWTAQEICKVINTRLFKNGCKFKTKPFTLRYWEKEFKIVVQQKNDWGVRKYTVQDSRKLYNIASLISIDLVRDWI